MQKGRRWWREVVGAEETWIRNWEWGDPGGAESGSRV